jgi:acyl dehydratase
MIDHKHIGLDLGTTSVEVEKYPIRFFAEAIGETNPIHHDEAAARREGFRSLVAPPTYVACLWSLAQPGGTGVVEALSIPMERVLHAEERFEYGEPICAGDVVEFRTRVADIYDRRNGALEFVVLETVATLADGRHAATTWTTMAIRRS